MKNGCVKLPPVTGEVRLKGKLYSVKAKLYDGPFSKVFVITDGARQYAMKIEENEGSARRVLKLDALVLKQLSRNGITDGFPQLLAAGRTSIYKYIIMELVGPDLQRLRRAIPNRRFSLATSLRIASQTLSRIEALHDCGWLCRDVKANNFCIGRQNLSLIYMLDFGFARRFVRCDGTLMERRTVAGLMGTIHYASINAHNFMEQCRKDDLESWFYMMIEMISGALPWQIHEPKTEYMLIGEWKKFTRESGRCLLLADCPVELDAILTAIDNCGFTTRPRYRLIQAFIRHAMERLNINQHAQFEWEIDPSIVSKTETLSDCEELEMLADFRRPEGDDKSCTQIAVAS